MQLQSSCNPKVATFHGRPRSPPALTIHGVDPHFEKRYLISLRNLPSLPSEKTIHLALLSVDGTVTPAAVDNPTFKKEVPEQERITYEFDEARLTINAAPTLIRCEETASKVVLATFEVQGVGFSERTKAYLIVDKDKEQELEFVFEASTRSVLRVKDPGFELKILLKDSESKLRTRKVINWTKPTDGCQAVAAPPTN